MSTKLDAMELVAVKEAYHHDIAELNERLMERQTTLIEKGVECEEMRKKLQAAEADASRLAGVAANLMAAGNWRTAKHTIILAETQKALAAHENRIKL